MRPALAGLGACGLLAFPLAAPASHAAAPAADVGMWFRPGDKPGGPLMTFSNGITTVHFRVQTVIGVIKPSGGSMTLQFWSRKHRAWLAIVGKANHKEIPFAFFPEEGETEVKRFVGDCLLKTRERLHFFLRLVWDDGTKPFVGTLNLPGRSRGVYTGLCGFQVARP